MADELALRYGTNPHQAQARVYHEHGPLPFTVRNGAPGYINLLDALNGWQLVRELRAATGLAAAASFKHVSPAGAAVAVPLSDAERAACFAPRELSAPATAYARARGTDRVCSYGDWIALSDPVDEATARLIRPEVSDGIIAPGYQPAALELLAAKKGGGYHVLEIDADYRPPPVERRTVFGVTLEQARNERAFDAQTLAAAGLPEEVVRDLTVGLIALKYTQSNSVCLCARGQTIGVAAGQQSRNPLHAARHRQGAHLAAAPAPAGALAALPARGAPPGPRHRDRLLRGARPERTGRTGAGGPPGGAAAAHHGGRGAELDRRLPGARPLLGRLLPQSR